MGLGQLEADSSQTQRQVCRRCVASPRFWQACIQRKTWHTPTVLQHMFKNAFSDITWTSELLFQNRRFRSIRSNKGGKQGGCFPIFRHYTHGCFDDEPYHHPHPHPYHYHYCRERQMHDQRPISKSKVTYVCCGDVAARKKTWFLQLRRGLGLRSQK